MLTHPFKDAHVYGVFNFAVGIGAAGKSVGHSWPQQTFYERSSCVTQWARYLAERYNSLYFCDAHNLISLSFLQIFEHFSNGWTILNLVVVVIIITAVAVVVLFTGERPLVGRLRGGRPVLTSKMTDAT